MVPVMLAAVVNVAVLPSPRELVLLAETVLPSTLNVTPAALIPAASIEIVLPDVPPKTEVLPLVQVEGPDQFDVVASQLPPPVSQV